MGVHRGPGLCEVAESLMSSENQGFSPGLSAAPFHLGVIRRGGSLWPVKGRRSAPAFRLLPGPPQTSLALLRRGHRRLPLTQLPRVPRTVDGARRHTCDEHWMCVAAAGPSWPREQVCLRSLLAHTQAGTSSSPDSVPAPVLASNCCACHTCTPSSSATPGMGLAVGDPAGTKGEGKSSSPAA